LIFDLSLDRHYTSIQLSLTNHTLRKLCTMELYRTTHLCKWNVFCDNRASWTVSILIKEQFQLSHNF